jgi:acid stress chaperone HdeB
MSANFMVCDVIGKDRGRLPMNRYFWIVAAVAIVGSTGQAMAAERDMSKITCKEVADMPGAKPMAVVMWVNGYIHGKLGNPMIDGDKAHENAEKVATYCREHPDSTVASAIETLANM